MKVEQKKFYPSIDFYVPGKIKSKQRPRFFNGHAVTPKDTVNYENWIKLCFTQELEKRKAKADLNPEVPVRVTIIARFPVPKSYTKRKKETIEKNEILPLKKPDVDNIAKIVCDSLNGLAYHDDKQVIRLVIEKQYIKAEGQEEGLRVMVDYIK